MLIKAITYNILEYCGKHVTNMLQVCLAIFFLGKAHIFDKQFDNQI